jgi:uncharacterized protein YbjT (DUF2867 family)
VKQGVEVITGNLDEPSGFREHVRGADALFSVQSQSKGKEREIQQGIDLANIAGEMGVSHLVYTSVAGAHMNTGIPHFESKRVIEEHIKSTGIPYTILRPASLYENFLIPQVKSRVYKGKLVTPLAPATIQQMVASEDVGRMTVHAMMNPELYVSRTIFLVAEQMSMMEAARVFSEAMGNPVRYMQLPRFITRLVMGKDLYTMFRWMDANNAIFTDFKEAKQQLPQMIDLKTWIHLNFLNPPLPES